MDFTYVASARVYFVPPYSFAFYINNINNVMLFLVL